ncbi:MAG: FAD binding domain-containing protein [Anaerolineae bacterium]
MKPFTYQAPTSVEEAVALLDEYGPQARPLAGGTDILVQLRRGRHDLDLLVDVKRIPEMLLIDYAPAEGLTVGAAVTCAVLSEQPVVRRLYPGLLDGASIIGGTAIQGRATLGGNLGNAAPSGDAIVAMMVLGADAILAGPSGRRRVPVSEFCTGPGETVQQRGELIVAFHFPPPTPATGARYLRFIPRGEMDIAVAGAGAWIALDSSGETVVDARIALGAVAPTPLLVDGAREVLVGQPLTEALFAAAAQAAREAARPIDDTRGTAAQRRHLVEVLVKRALAGAVERARAWEMEEV